MLSGLHALHEHDLLHLDIKPENILFETMDDDSKILITDFGLSKMLNGLSFDEKKVPTMELLQLKLKAFQESGKLRRYLYLNDLILSCF